MTEQEARALFLEHCQPGDMSHYGEKAAVAAILAAVGAHGRQHVAYVDEGKFEWMSGIKPRDCELYADWIRA